MSLKSKSRLSELRDFALLFRLTHRLVLLLRSGLGDCTRAFALPHLLLDCCLHFRRILHYQAMNSPQSRSANEINIKLEGAIITDLM